MSFPGKERGRYSADHPPRRVKRWKGPCRSVQVRRKDSTKPTTDKSLQKREKDVLASSAHREIEGEKKKKKGFDVPSCERTKKSEGGEKVVHDLRN